MDKIYENTTAIKSILRGYISYQSNVEQVSDFDLLDIVIDIGNAISRCNLTDEQMKILDMYIDGYTEEEIATEMNVSQPAINQRITGIAKRISDYLVKR